MGSITGYTRRTANIGSGAGGGAAIKTIYTDNDIIDNQIREVSLYGNTSSDKLIFQNLAGNHVLVIKGDTNISNNGCPTNSSTNSIVGGSASSVNNRNSIAWGEGAVANGAYSASFGNSTVSGYGGLAWGNGNTVNGNQGAASGGSGNTASGLSSFAMGINNTASGTQSAALGLQSISGGLASMAFGYVAYASADYSAVLGGFSNTVVALANYSCIVGGTANVVNASVLRSVILGGTAITATVNDTAYALNVAIGTGSPTARLEVKGSGSTSATTTALFKNSSSVANLKIRDDNYVIQRAINAAIADADLANNEMSAYIDETTSFLIFKVKTSTGVVKTASIALV